MSIEQLIAQLPPLPHQQEQTNHSTTTTLPSPLTRPGNGNANQVNGSYIQVAVRSLAQHPYNVRQSMDEASLTELAASITAQGLLQPLVIVPVPSDYHAVVTGQIEQRANFWVLAGNRRLAAARLAGLKYVSCILREDLATIEAQRLAMLVENLQRQNLSPIEQAQAFMALRHQASASASELDGSSGSCGKEKEKEKKKAGGKGLTIAQIAEQIGRSTAYVCDYLAILELPQALQDRITRREISHQAAIAATQPGLNEPYRKLFYAELLTAERMTVRQAKARVAELIERQQAEQALLEKAEVQTLKLKTSVDAGADVTAVSGLSGPGTMGRDQVSLPDRRIGASTGGAGPRLNQKGGTAAQLMTLRQQQHAGGSTLREQVW